MLIAVCDDNIADRKQTERLMAREADKWIAEGDTFYTESYGNAQALLGTPMAFDAFMIDICHTPGLEALDMVDRLREKGVIAPMIMLCSDVNYRDQAFDEGTLFLDKPLQPALIHEMMLKVKEYTLSKEPLIELRGDETMYVKDDEILYAEHAGYTSNVQLTAGRHIVAGTTVENMFDEICDEHDSFIMLGSRVMININYVASTGFHKVIMTDGKKFSANGEAVKYINKHLAK